MADVIYRQTAIKAVHGEFDNLYLMEEDGASLADMVESVLNRQPPAEPEIVRCKNCKHLFDGEHNANCCEVLMRKAKWLTEITVDMNWYCADGERRAE